MLPSAAADDVSLCEIFIAPKRSTLIVSEQDYALMGGEIMNTNVWECNAASMTKMLDLWLEADPSKHWDSSTKLHDFLSRRLQY